MKPKQKKCRMCSCEFTPYTSLDKFCSSTCRINHQKSLRSRNWSIEKVEGIKGVNNPCFRSGMYAISTKKNATGLRTFFKNRDEYREELIDKHGYLLCEKCGISSAKFEAHHIVYRSEKPAHEHLHSKQNILNLCVKCHNWYHLKKENRNEIVNERRLDLLFGNDILDK